MSQWLLVITLTHPQLIMQHWDIIGGKTATREAGGTPSGQMQKHAFTSLWAPHLQDVKAERVVKVERVPNMWSFNLWRYNRQHAYDAKQEG